MEKRDAMEALAKKLLEKEVINLPDIIETLGERPWPMKENLKEYLEEMKERQKEDEEEKMKAEAEEIEKEET